MWNLITLWNWKQTMICSLHTVGLLLKYLLTYTIGSAHSMYELMYIYYVWRCKTNVIKYLPRYMRFHFFPVKTRNRIVNDNRASFIDSKHWKPVVYLYGDKNLIFTWSILLFGFVLFCFIFYIYSLRTRRIANEGKHCD